MKIRRAVYPGSFDPITKGHVDIVQRLAPMFDELVVLISTNSSKQYLFSNVERLRLARTCLKAIPSVRVDEHAGLTVDYLRKNKIKTIVRGIRAASDFEMEMTMANMNRSLYEGAETIVILARPELSFVASSLVKDIAKHHGPLRAFVPAVVETALKKKFLKSGEK
ncbi:MAG: pantetheine-phosphate adenylyltransferase [Bdellovibrionales bacterium]|nr:pantetheine-phosphate adenylyltransferase [Bdellovibrionales bacterium]